MYVFDIKLKAKTAGPSPDNNNRTEVFLFGCNKACQGDPCPGCFNSATWDSSIATISWDPIELAKKIHEVAPNKYITIGGGEPTDQLDELIMLCKELKKYGHHILMYTWRDLQKALKGYTINDMNDNNNKYPINAKKLNELLEYIDIVIDGEYKAEERTYIDNYDDGFLSSIGSGNQKVWDIKRDRNYEYVRDIKGIKLNSNDDLIFILKEV